MLFNIQNIYYNIRKIIIAKINLKNNSKITDINNLNYVLKRYGYYWSDVISKSNSEEVFVSIHKIKSGGEAPSHIHKNEEIIFVLNGSITLKIENKTTNLYENQIYNVPANTAHSIQNKSNRTSKVMIIFGTNDPFHNTIYQ